MKTFHCVLTSVLGAGMLASAMPADAHGIWFAQRARQLALVYGVGADDLDAAKRVPLINAVEGFDAAWAPVKASFRIAGPIPLVDSDEPLAAIAAAMDYGMWSKSPDGEWHNKGKDEVPGAIVAERTMKFAVHVADLANAQVPVIASQTLQLVPVDKALPVEMGKPVKLRVLFKGKPIAGAVVINDFVNDPDQAGQKSAADGSVTLTVRNQGLNVLAATYVGPTDAPTKYDRIEYKATLSFVLPHLPE
ncbi:DUF4198 domain-containing protein [Aquisediminimonas sediminicola]|uniref:DUF4198 domain-containing protein n=1 Tax=Alteraquisediminimonas sediminicola TaxID=2676787 RepID=UPI001C8EC82B|nr:DUF4198 domain-containing protein [Aquisediminimonas sediminicola]